MIIKMKDLLEELASKSIDETLDNKFKEKYGENDGELISSLFRDSAKEVNEFTDRMKHYLTSLKTISPESSGQLIYNVVSYIIFNITHLDHDKTMKVMKYIESL